MIAPDVAMPPARLRVPSNAPTVPHSSGMVMRSAIVLTRNIVVPYMSMRSPGCCAPTLTASVQASIVPETTGVPTGRPVAAAAVDVTVPTIESDHTSGGSSMSPTIGPAHGQYHACATES